MKLVQLKIVLIALLLTFSFTVSAQPGPPDDPDVPITGIEILMGVGGLLGLRKLYSKGRAQSKLN